jgi:hypothetical protein
MNVRKRERKAAASASDGPKPRRAARTILMDPDVDAMLDLYTLGMRARRGVDLDRSDVVNALVREHCRRFSLRDLEAGGEKAGQASLEPPSTVD